MDGPDFGASVWGSDDPKPFQAPSVASFDAPVDGSDFDDFDDFDTAPSELAATDDDFGDFGDVNDVSNDDGFGSQMAFEDNMPIAGPSSYTVWEPLKLLPMPERGELEEQIRQTYAPLAPEELVSALMTDDPIRESQGYSQILVTLESRNLFNELIKAPPPTKPPNWTRSRIRRQHLIALGIPVNLDEVLPHANGKPLPPLEIITRPMSAPPGSRGSAPPSAVSRANSPHPQVPSRSSHLGPKPELDMEKIQELLALDPDTLTMQSLATVEQHYTQIRTQTANTSNLLTYLLQSRDALQQDSETYNGLIAELVGEAQKIKTGKPGRRGSGLS